MLRWNGTKHDKNKHTRQFYTPTKESEEWDSEDL